MTLFLLFDVYKRFKNEEGVLNVFFFCKLISGVFYTCG